MGWFESDEELERVLDWLRQRVGVLIREEVQQEPPFITPAERIPAAFTSAPTK